MSSAQYLVVTFSGIKIDSKSMETIVLFMANKLKSRRYEFDSL